MFKVVRFNSLLCAGAILALIAALTPALVLAANGGSRRAFSQAPRLTVVLDAGHGGADPGVTGAKTGVKESDLNLKMALTLGELLSSAGFKAVQTRVSEEALVSGAYNKKEDMAARKRIIEKADPKLVISLHMNRYEDASRRGIQVFYSTDHSEAFASLMQKQLNAVMNEPTLGRGFSPLKGDYFIAQCSGAPSIIIECAFLSSPLDEALITDPNYRLRLAIEIQKAIERYLSEA